MCNVKAAIEPEIKVPDECRDALMVRLDDLEARLNNLHDECMAILKEYPDPMTLEDIQKLEYIDKMTRHILMVARTK